MKSIIEEASSVSKAIEKGWLRAGKPKDFSIKIYEEPEKNFFGITVKSAKIAVIFEEKITASPITEKPKHIAQQAPQKSDAKRPRGLKQHTLLQENSEQPKQKEFRKKLSDPSQSQQTNIVETISEDITHEIKTWLDHMLSVMNMHHIPFIIETFEQTVQVTFASQLMADAQQEKTFLKSLSYLTLATLRNKFKKGLRGLKLVFVRKIE